MAMAFVTSQKSQELRILQLLQDDEPVDNTSNIEDPDPEEEPKGELQPIASRVRMQGSLCVYGT